eukprot:TRINITY_DN15614_c0_g1_i1.p1 TRINITY_DN15614_c0_g1~~TRINITY_DN15614_c0_g1_i1.p1  ORF type:complete len:515 (+),score=68.07 TRINITY_DN15614_c0_g1_i1:137-1681(+)
MSSSGAFAPLEFGNLYYHLRGPEEGELVVFLHGFSQTADGWAAVASDLVERTGFRALCFDFYGCGRSECPRMDYTLALYVSQTHQLLEYLTLNLMPALFIGSSMGGLVASAFARDYPDLVRSLILTNPAGVPTSMHEFRNPSVAGARLIFKLARTPFISSLVGRAACGIVKHVMAPVILPAESEFVKGTFRHRLRGLLTGAGVQHSTINDIMYGISSDYDGYWRASISTLANINLLSDLTSIYSDIGKHSRPVLLIWGSEDVILPQSCGDLLLSMMPNAKLVKIDKAGHGPHAVCHELYVRHVFEFLESHGFARVSSVSDAEEKIEALTIAAVLMEEDATHRQHSAGIPLQTSDCSLSCDDSSSAELIDSEPTTPRSGVTNQQHHTQLPSRLWLPLQLDSHEMDATMPPVSAESNGMDMSFDSSIMISPALLLPISPHSAPSLAQALQHSDVHTTSATAHTRPIPHAHSVSSSRQEGWLGWLRGKIDPLRASAVMVTLAAATTMMTVLPRTSAK